MGKTEAVISAAVLSAAAHDQLTIRCC